MRGTGTRHSLFYPAPCIPHPPSSILHVFELGGELDFLFQKSLIAQSAVFVSVVCEAVCEFDIVHKGLNIGI